MSRDDRGRRDEEAYEVPPGAPTHECPRCGRPFARERHRDLHLGQSHGDLTDGELGLLVLFYVGVLFLVAIFG